MTRLLDSSPKPEELWQRFLTEGNPELTRLRRFFRVLPHNPRCKNCNAPFKGVGGFISSVGFNQRQSSHNPLMCTTCENFAAKYLGGGEVEMAMHFADVRGSTTLAEKMIPMAFSRLINRFYNVSVSVLSQADAFIDRLVGDEMIGYFIPGLAGQDWAQQAVNAAVTLLRATGHSDPGGPWIPVGIGVHQGLAFFGAVEKEDGIVDITALGDEVNAAARLASQAGTGEVLVSDAAYAAAGLNRQAVQRKLTLKGRTEPLLVRVLTA